MLHLATGVLLPRTFVAWGGTFSWSEFRLLAKRPEVLRFDIGTRSEQSISSFDAFRGYIAFPLIVWRLIGEGLKRLGLAFFCLSRLQFLCEATLARFWGSDMGI
jgi:hypothetical protein